MSTLKHTTDKKGMPSSLSADAAEFVPQCGAPQHANSRAETPSNTSHIRWKEQKPVEVTEVPRYLTSCYPFVSPENMARHHMPRFSQNCPYTGGMPPTLPIPVTPPIRFSTWQPVKSGFVDNFQSTSYGPMSFDLLASLPVDMFNVRGDGLLPIPAKMGVTAPPSSAQGMLLTAHSDSAASWIMTVPPPMFLQQQQQLHASQPQPQLTVTTNTTTTTTYVNATATASSKRADRPKTIVNSGSHRNADKAARPQSPVLISRSTQTDLPAHVNNFTLEEVPHPLYVSQGRKDQSALTRSGINCEGRESELEDSDSGYNSPMHKNNLVSSGTQVIPSRIPPGNSTIPVGIAHSGVRSHRGHEHSQSKPSARTVGKTQMTDNRVCVKSAVGSCVNENMEADGKKKRRKKKDERYASRSPKLLGSNTKLLSRSSSSLSSSGTRPDEDDEKIDLYSWTDFPPMSSRGVSLSASSKPVKSSEVVSERVPLMVERSANEPPWSIKFSSVDQTRSEHSRSPGGEKDKHSRSPGVEKDKQSRSPSGEKEKILSSKLNVPPESAWGNIGRSFKDSQAAGLGKELSLLMTSDASVPLLSSGGKTNNRGSLRDLDTSITCDSTPALKSPSMQANSNNTPRGSGSGRGARGLGESRTNAKSKMNSQKVVNGVFRSHTDQGKEVNASQSTLTGSTNPTSLTTTYSTVSSASLSPRQAVASATLTTTTSSSMGFAGGFATMTTTVSPYKDNALITTGSHLQASVSLPYTYTSAGSSHSAVHGLLLVEPANDGARNGTESYTMPNPLSLNDENSKSVSGAAISSSFTRAGSITLTQPASSSALTPISLSSWQQPASFINLNAVPVGALRPMFQGAPPSVNYHIPPPAQGPLPVHPTRSSHPHPAFTSYANIAQGLYSARTTSPGFLTRGANSQTVHRVASPFQNSSIPPAHTFAPSAPCPYFPGIVTYQPPAPHASGMVQSLYDLTLQPPALTAANVSPSLANAQKSSDVCVPSMRSSHNSAVSHCVSSTYKMADTGTISTVDTSIQQQFIHEQSSQNISDATLVSRTVDDNDKRKRRRRRRTRGRKGGKDAEEGDGESDGSRVLECSISNVSESTLHFEDMDEFPGLLTSSGHVEDVGERATLSGTSVTYSDILRSTWSKAGSQSRTQSLTGSCVSGDIDDEDNASSHTGTTNESRRARKRRKRREQANKAAEAELAEISLEQQWLKEVGLKKSVNHRAEGAAMSDKSTPGLITDSYVISEAKRHTTGKAGDKKFQQPIAFDIAAMIDAIQKKPPLLTDSSIIKSPTTANSAKAIKKENLIINSVSSNVPGNLLDSSAPLQKRGKEREIGKSKKPSPLKKVILKEREQRKRLRLLDEDPGSATGIGSVGTSSGVGVVGGESELSQDALSNKSGDTDGEDTNEAAELSADFSPISQTSPISMSPVSPGNSGVNSPITGSVGRDPVVMKIHSRRFREYCTQILDKEIDQCCTSLLQDLVKFQDRMYHKDPVKAKSKRRVVLGLREVTKHLKLKKIKCVVISPNLEKIQSKGGLDEALNNILNMCREQDVPFVFALGRRALGRACAKLVPVSVVGIFNYEGCDSKYRSLISLTAAARTAYNEMVLAVEKEVAEYPTIASQTSSIGGVPGLFAAHMGHSRTPSGCSAISFTSSILSEPISENFPHAEPEVDSKGYEIVRDAAGNVVHPSGPGVNSKKAGLAGGLVADIDDGNEADTEDICEMRRKRRGGRPMNSVRFGGVGYVSDSKAASSESNGRDKSCDVNVDGASDDADERSTIGKLSRNVSELTLTNEDNFILKGEPYALKHKSSLQDFNDDKEEFDDDKDICDDNDDSKSDHENIYGDSESTSYGKWGRVSHIDSIHSQSYCLGDDIFSHHSSQSHDHRARSHSMTLTGHSSSQTSLVGVGGGSDGHHTGQKSNSFNDKDDDVDNIIENVEDAEEEEENEATERHHRVIDKERIKNWLESQSNISTED